MSKQEFDSLFYHYLVGQEMSPTRAYETVVQTRGFLDTKPSWVILQHDGSGDEFV
jgi:hypothetical protein